MVEERFRGAPLPGEEGISDLRTKVIRNRGGKRKSENPCACSTHMYAVDFAQGHARFRINELRATTVSDKHWIRLKIATRWIGLTHIANDQVVRADALRNEESFPSSRRWQGDL